MKNPFRSKSKPKPKSKSTDDSNSGSSHSSSSSSSSVLPRPVATAIADLEEAFNFIDKNHDGKLTASELTHMLISTGITPLESAVAEAETMMRVLDVNGDGCISLDEFMAIRWPKQQSGSNSNDDDYSEEDEMREVFKVFDKNGDGRISAEELYMVLSAMEEDEGKCTVEECRRMIDCVDGDGDGFVGFQDFKIMMMGRRRRDHDDSKVLVCEGLSKD